MARELARIMDIPYLDTGAMYRAITLKIMRSGMSFDDTAALQELLESTVLEIISGEEGTIIYMDDEDVSSEIRSPAVGNNVSQVSSIRMVRSSMVWMQQDLVRKWGEVVMDGRDIGTCVIPDARFKFYLDATVEERARRRWKELREKGRVLAFEEVKEEIAMRDRIDTERDESPLKVAPGAIVVDTTHMSLESVIDKILGYIGKK